MSEFTIDLEYGPWPDAHPAGQDESQFRAHLDTWLREVLVPQLPGVPSLIEGKISAGKEPCHCELDVFTVIDGRRDEATAILVYEAEAGTFSESDMKPLQLVNEEVRRQINMFFVPMQEMAQRYEAGERELQCPICEKALEELPDDAGMKCSACSFEFS